MTSQILETQTEQAHQEAVEHAEEREEKVHEAIEKIGTTIDELTRTPADLPASEFETTLPMPPESNE
jgi:hypothetical protein